MTDWVRLWHDMPTDPKWRVIARKSGQPLPCVIALFTLLMTTASAAEERGDVSTLTAEDAAAALDMDEEAVEAILAAMDGRVITAGRLSGWDRRQPKREDNSAARVKAFRERKQTHGNAEKREEPEVKRPVTQRNAPEKETDTDTEGSEANASGAVAPKLSASDITKAIFDTGIAILTSAGHPEQRARSIIGRWRKDFTDPEVLSVLSRCADDVSEPVEWVVAALQFQREKSTGATDGQRFQRSRFNPQSSGGVVSVAHSVIAKLDPTYFDPAPDEGGSDEWASPAPSWEGDRGADELSSPRKTSWHGRG